MFPNLSGSSRGNNTQVRPAWGRALPGLPVFLKEGVVQVVPQCKSWWSGTQTIFLKWIAMGPIALYSYSFMPALFVDIMLTVLPEGTGNMGIFECCPSAPAPAVPQPMTELFSLGCGCQHSEAFAMCKAVPGRGQCAG